ncbi:MAG: NAD(P)/FAD-dependent oxidoreductase [Candidatus Dadabacteria bacterium]|nr:MAG: NAD(P)/FAD-dependent oxidoreductase [Candidatus Dadabacteria bacterium]
MLIRDGLRRSRQEPFPIVIIGAGFGGVGMGIALKEAGLEDFTILERGDDVGGTWRDNTYPGCACDVPSHLYSYSFALNPNWTRAYSPWNEIRDYIRDCAERWDIMRHIRFGTAVEEAWFDETQALWHLRTSAGEEHTARVVVSAVGGLVNPKIPDLEGRDDFAGPAFHTARWRHDVDLRGKRVAVVGTGASAIQVVPSIAPEVGHLTVFQRTPPWIMPKPDRAFTELEKALNRHVPGLMRLRRTGIYLATEAIGTGIVWNNPVNQMLETIARRHIEQEIPDPELRRKLTPDFRLGCKRLLFSSEYYPVFLRDNVELVTAPAKRVTKTGITDSEGTHRRFDVIVWATGFSLDIARAPFPIRGLGGRTLDEAWANGAQAWKGVAIHGFPNWFTIMGPNTGPGHTSVLVYSEAQIHHILGAIRYLRRTGARFLQVRADAQQRYNDELQRRLPNTNWNAGCTSWYLGADGQNLTLFPGYAGEYVLRTRQFWPFAYDIAS